MCSCGKKAAVPPGQDGKQLQSACVTRALTLRAARVRERVWSAQIRRKDNTGKRSSCDLSGPCKKSFAQLVEIHPRTQSGGGCPAHPGASRRSLSSRHVWIGRGKSNCSDHRLWWMVGGRTETESGRGVQELRSTYRSDWTAKRAVRVRW